jgi:hypothetical protein
MSAAANNAAMSSQHILRPQLSDWMPKAAVVFNWNTVGNPGNAADPATGFGSTSQVYCVLATMKSTSCVGSCGPTGKCPSPGFTMTVIWPPNSL